MVALNQYWNEQISVADTALNHRKTPPDNNSFPTNRLRSLLRARYYDPHTAEFLSPDPLEYVDGMSLFRGYFALESQDPSGEIKVINERVHKPNGEVCNGDVAGIAWDWQLDKERKEGWIIQRVEFSCKKCECDHCGECNLNCEEKGPYVYFEAWRVDGGKGLTAFPKENGDNHTYRGFPGACLTSIRSLEARFYYGKETKVNRRDGWKFTQGATYGHDYCQLTSGVLPHYSGTRGEPQIWKNAKLSFRSKNEKPVVTKLKLTSNCCNPDGNGGYRGDGYYDHEWTNIKR